MFKRENVINSTNMSGDAQYLRLMMNGFATAVTLDRTVYPPLMECWKSQVGAAKDIITWSAMTGCGGGGQGGAGILSINNDASQYQQIVGGEGISVVTAGGVTTVSATITPQEPVNLAFSEQDWLPLNDDEWYKDFNHNLNSIPVMFRMFDQNGMSITEGRHQIISPDTIRVMINRFPDSRFQGNIYISK